ncbi:MAG: protein kinase [Deltaproteobacteria bacterium]|nr:protein kinase [Deltaproteobacteria bacterium]
MNTPSEKHSDNNSDLHLQPTQVVVDTEGSGPVNKISDVDHERYPTAQTSKVDSGENRFVREGPLSGTLFEGKYKVGELIGEGGMGQVYKATHVMMKKTVALKILQSVLSAQPDIVERFRREAESADRLSSAHIINVRDFGRSSDGLFYLVMEYVEGIPLSNFLFEGPMDWRRASRIMMQILSALEDAHRNGIIHRDLKPDNIMISTSEGGEEIVKILDFGIAKLAEGEEKGMQVTRAGMIFGTPSYISPEQAKGQNVTPASDLYSAGIIFYQMLVGELPFTAESTIDLINKHIKEIPPPVRKFRPDVPPEIEFLISRSLSKKSKDRPKNAFEMKAVLGNALNLTKFIETVPISLSGRFQDFFVTAFGKFILFLFTLVLLSGVFYFMFIRQTSNQTSGDVVKHSENVSKKNVGDVKSVNKSSGKNEPDVIELLIKKGKLAEALSIAEEDLKKNPSNKTAVQNLGKVRKLFVEKGKKSALVELAAITDNAGIDGYIVKLRLWLSWFPTDGELNYFIALAYSRQKNHSTSIKHFNKALLLKPDLGIKKESKVFIIKYLRNKKQWIRSLMVKTVQETYGNAKPENLVFLLEIINDEKVDVDERYSIYRFVQLRGLSKGIRQMDFWKWQLKWSTVCSVRKEACQWFKNNGTRNEVRFLKRELKTKYYRTGSGAKVSTACYLQDLRSAINESGKRRPPTKKARPMKK